MGHNNCYLVSVLLIALGVAVAQAGRSADGSSAQLQDHTRLATRAQNGIGISWGGLPLSFEVNEGQINERVRFLSRGRGCNLFLTPREVILALRKQRRGHTAAVLRIGLVGGNSAPEIEGLDELPGRSNYFIGSDPRKWRTKVPHYARVRYRGVYPGIDLIFHGTEGKLEYDFVVASGGDPTEILLAFEGVDIPKLDSERNLVLHAEGAEVTQRVPSVYQGRGGRKREIKGRYALRGGAHVGFDLTGYDPAERLVIDPVLDYSTYLGGSGGLMGDWPSDIVLNPFDNSAYLTGTTDSANFPTADPLQPASAGLDDVFVTRLNSTGSALIYSTYLGGSMRDKGFGIGVDLSGNAYVTGWTESVDFPTANAMQSFKKGAQPDLFVTKLNALGSALLYSTYLGGTSEDGARDIAVDGSGQAYITGYTLSDDFPLWNAVQGTHFHFTGTSDAFVTKLGANGQEVIYSTLLGGKDTDQGRAIAVDAGGNAYVTGGTRSTDFPKSLNPFQMFLHGNTDAFLTVLQWKPTATGYELELAYSTYLGGSAGPTTFGNETGFGIAVDASGNAYVAGETTSVDFPTTTGCLQATYGGGGDDGFVSKFNVDLTGTGTTSLVYSSYLGGSGRDWCNDIAVDSWQNVYVIGTTLSSDFPTFYSMQSLQGNRDAFVSKLESTGSELAYSTYLGGGLGGVGSPIEEGIAIAVDANGGAYVTGVTESINFPTAKPFQAANAGNKDVFVAKIIEFGIVSITLSDTTDVKITWESKDGQKYRIQFKDDLMDPEWTDLADVVATGHVTSWIDTGAGAVRRRFYRIRPVE